MNRIIEELEYSINIMKKIGCKTIDISDKAIEETAGIILNWYKENNYK
jgi:regulator of PEP synthase PpsR (kinase-PPPase family)